MLQHVLVYISHHQGAHKLCCAKVTMLISDVHVVNEVFGAVAVYFIQARCACTLCTFQNETHFILHSARCARTLGLNKTCSHSTKNFINHMYI